MPDKKINKNEVNYNRLKNKIEKIEIEKTPIEALLMIEQLKKIIKVKRFT